MKAPFATFIVLLSCTLFAKPIDTGKLKNENGFIKNEGQIYDQNGNQNRQVLFLFTSPTLSVQLRDNGFSYELRQTEASTNSILSEPMLNAINSIQKAHRIDIDFVGSNSLIEKIVCEQNVAEVRMHNKQNANQVNTQRSIKRILYKNVYPQIDIEFLVTEIEGKARFKYNIILHPGADESKVQFLIEGASKNTLTKEGSIAMKTTLGVLEEQVPLSYELTKQGRQGRSIGARFRQIHERLFGITVDAKNRQNTLVIDPLAWGTYLGGDSEDDAANICVDTLGNIYVAGTSYSTSGLATAGAYQTTMQGIYDGYVAKYSSVGALLWCTYIGGAGTDYFHEIILDKNQNLYVVGETNSTTGISTLGSYKEHFGGSRDGMIIKFSHGGNVLWGTYFGGENTEIFSNICLDPFGDLLAIGYSYSGDLTFSYPNIHQSSIAGNRDALLVKIGANGNVKWASYFGGPHNDLAIAACSDAHGNFFIAGTTSSPYGIATIGAHKATLSADEDAFFAKFNTFGTLTYATYYGGVTPASMVLDVDNNLVIVGTAYSYYGIATAGANDTSYSNLGTDGFILKMDTSVNILWATYHGNGWEKLTKVRADALGNIYIKGVKQGIWPNITQYISTYNKVGQPLPPPNLGIGLSNAVDFEIDRNGNMYLVGVTTLDSGIATPSGHDTSNSSSDAFIQKYENVIPILLEGNEISSTQNLCSGTAASMLSGTQPIGGSGSYSYLWTSSTTGAAGAYTPAAGVNNASSYNPGVIGNSTWYKRTVFSGDQILSSNVVNININEKLRAGFTTNKLIQCAKNNNFIFSDTTLNGNPNITHTWNFGNGMYSGNAIDSMSFVFDTENTFVVTLINSLNGACADTASVRIYLIPNPPPANIVGNANVLRGKTEMYSVTPRTGSTYTWIYDKGIGTSNTATINIKWTDLGTTELKLLEQTGGGCYGDTAYLNITIDKPLGGSELAWDSDLLLYPNPSHGMVFIQDGLNRNLAISVQSILGEQVFEGKAQLDGSIDLNHLNNGIYLIKLYTSDGDSFVRRMEIID
jgi:hypothetical protein